MKKLIAAFTAAITALCAQGLPCIAAAPSVSAGTASAKPGATIEILITLADNVGFASLGVEIGYDASVMTLTGVANTKDVGGKYLYSQTYDKNPYFIGWENEDNIYYNGTLATMTFKINESAPAGMYDVTVDYYKGRNGDYEDGDDTNFNEDYEPLNLTYVNGSIEIVGDELPTETSTPTPEPAIDGISAAAASVKAKPGETVEIPITITDNTGFASLGIEIGYDASVMTLTGVANTKDVGGKYLYSQTYDKNPYFIGWENEDNIYYNGTLATMTFKINENAPAGVYDVTVDYYKGRDGDYIDGDDTNFDEDWEPLNLTYVNGSITVVKESAVKVTTGSGGDRSVKRTDGSTDKVYDYTVTIPEDITITADDITVKIGNITAKKQSSFAKKFEAITGGSVSFTSAVTNIPAGASLKDIKCVVSVSYVIDGISTTDEYEFDLE